MFDAAVQGLAFLEFQGVLKQAIAVLVAGTPLLLAIMLVHKLVTERLERLFNQAKHHYLSTCYRYLAEGSPLPEAPRGNRETLALADVLIYMMTETPPEKHRQLRELATALQVAPHLRYQAIHGRSWVSRLLAVEKLGFLQLPEMIPLYKDLLARELEPHVIAKTLWAVSQVATGEELHLINRIVTSRPVYSGKFNELLYWNVIAAFRRRGAGAELAAEIEKMLECSDLPMQLKRDLAEACGGAGFTEAKPLLHRACLVYAGDSTMKIACLRAIGMLGGDREGALTAPALDDPDWRVRAVAARYASLAPNRLTPSLARLLGDGNYHVRLNAARSLAAMGEEGRDMLRRQLESQDRFVREVSAYVLEDARG